MGHSARHFLEFIGTGCEGRVLFLIGVFSGEVIFLQSLRDFLAMRLGVFVDEGTSFDHVILGLLLLQFKSRRPRSVLFGGLIRLLQHVIRH